MERFDGKLLALVMGGVAHDSNNLVAPVVGFSEMIDLCEKSLVERYPGLDREPEIKQIRQCVEHIVRAMKIVYDSNRSLLELCRPYYISSEAKTNATDIKELMEQCRELAASISPGVRIVSRGLSSLPVLPCSPAIVSTLFRELIHNSLNANRGKLDELTILFTVKYNPSDSMLVIKFLDNGVGFTENNPIRPPKTGGHYGLYFISEMARRLNGWFHSGNRKNGGAEVSLALVINP